MTSSPSTREQYAFRSQKHLGLVSGYDPLQLFDPQDVSAKTYVYSRDGSLYATALPASVRIYTAQDALLLQQVEVPNIVEISFSPLGTYLSTWERPTKLEDGAQHKNFRVWSVKSGEEVLALSQKSQDKWDFQYTSSESHAARVVGPEIVVFYPADWKKGVVDKLRIDNISTISVSPGKNPYVAVFVAEKNGAPASIRIYNLLNLSTLPTCQKNTFKADQCQIKWNALGTQVLFLTHTDVDKSNKSYYGETGLFLLSAAGNFDCRVTLDKEGPIHDFTWSPNSKEFGVVYGYMPAKAVLFDQRVNPIHSFDSHPWNFISFNPQARLLALAGFGNLAGKIDVFDRRTLQKITTIDAPNTSYCEWSGDGKSLMTATLSPRLRVDNGIKIWHCTGPLMHVHPIEELYQTSWRPSPPESAPPFGNVLPTAPAPSKSVASSAPSTPTPNKPAGAYRPPGARGLATPSIYKREDEGGAPRVPTNGTSTPPRSQHPHSNGNNNSANNNNTNNNNNNNYNGNNGTYAGSNGMPVRKRHVPGAPPPSNDSMGGGGGGGEDGGGKKGQGKRKKDKSKPDKKEKVVIEETPPPPPPPPPPSTSSPPPPPNTKVHPTINLNGLDTLKPPAPTSPEGEAEPPIPETPGLDSLDPIAKKIRNLTKKLKAIEELKEKAKRGDRLEVTQMKKMEGEVEIKKELASLIGAS